MQRLNEILDAALKINGPEFFKSKVPKFVISNLRNDFPLRDYQKESLGRLNFFLTEYHDRPKDMPTQLLFHMATGSGKTLIMAGMIIYLYEQGYRNFLFFVNSTNIIEKTKDNFFNKKSSKYLFSEQISIGDKQIKIKEVDNFQAINQNDINIVFSTIQGLHTRLNKPKENSITFDDFEENKIVLLSDEAHHINVETKKRNELKKTDIENILNWENTVDKIFNANKNNLLMEFTATIDLSNSQIENKYGGKLIFNYPLKEFRKDGFSKEVKVLQADLPKFERALQGVLLSQYRRKVFTKNKKIIKPVLLFKSRTISESKEFQNEFIEKMKNLNIQVLKNIQNSNTDGIINKFFQFLDYNAISLEDLVFELKEDFSKEKLISVNSKDESEHKQLAINSLEDELNEYRAVFAVDKLNEGWDVLNLFDIVRLYDTRDARSGKPGKTTMAEAQLIGRGARYCPFRTSDEHSFYKRKFDDDVYNELRICEELYYHSAYNPRYIQELNIALEDIGIKGKNSIERPMKLKSSFKETSFFKSGYIYLNKQKKYNREDIFSIKSSLKERSHKVELKTGYSKSSKAFGENNRDALDRTEKEYKLIDFGKTIIRKALNKLEFYKFSNLITHLPNLKSITEFINSKNYLGNIRLDVSGLANQVKNLTPIQKLEVTINILENIAPDIGSSEIELRGSKDFMPFMIKDKITDKKLNFTLSDSEDKEFGKSMINPVETKLYLDLSKKNWYVFEDCFGTSEEKLLIKYIDKNYDSLKNKFDEIFLVRNERYIRLYNFDDGKPMEPDYILFLKEKTNKKSKYYQIFIEPKGQHLIEKDKWKEDFLIKLKDNHSLEVLWKNKDYVIWGLPFYNDISKDSFETSFKALIQS